LNQSKSSFGLWVCSGLILPAMIFYLGCASTPAPQPSIAGINKVLLVGFPGKVWDDMNKGRRILHIAENKLALASNFDIVTDDRDPQELELIQWGRWGDPCLTFKMVERDDSALVDVNRVISLAQKKNVDAIMIGALRLYGARGGKYYLALTNSCMRSKGEDILGDAESDVTLEAILVGADGSCRWHGLKETSTSLGTGLKSMVLFGKGVADEVAYDRVERGLTYLFVTLPKPPRVD